MKSIFILSRVWISRLLLLWVPDFVIAGYLPARISRTLVIDTLILWSDQ